MRSFPRDLKVSLEQAVGSINAVAAVVAFMSLVVSGAQTAFARDGVITVSIVVPATAIYPGGVIAEDMLITRRIRVRRPIDGLYATRFENAVGLVAKRTLRANRAIPLSVLRRPYLFKEGQRVELHFSREGLSIVATGIALEPGGVGRIVSVRNVDSGLVVRGKVAGDGRVLVGGN